MRSESCRMDRLHFSSAQEWHAWLQDNHATSPGAWLTFFYAGTGKRGFTNREALEEALCFGWIDSLMRRIDEERYRQRYTPRTEGSAWSKANLARAKDLMEQGRMTEAGIARMPKGDGGGEKSATPSEILAPELRAMLEKEQESEKRFQAMPAWRRRMYVSWVMSAKKEETRARRMREMVTSLKEGGSPA